MITFQSQPNTIEPVYGNLVFQFTSTAATDPTIYRYRYVVNVFTQDGEVAQLKITPSTEGWGQCDLSPILMNYTHSKPVNVGCSGATPLHQSAWGVLNDNMINYSIMVGEEYATTPTGVLVLYDGEGNVGVPVVRSNVCFAYNGVKEWFNGKNYNFNPFLLTGSTTFNSGVDRFMTNSPRSRWIRTGDYMTLAALNWFDVEGDVNSRQVYSAVFKFYDEGDNLIQTSRTYNVESLCGTRPFCNYYDHFWTNPTNFAEEQVIYLGVGVPNITSHGIVFPDDVKYYSVELEATLNQPTPPDPEIEDFDGCSCWSYDVYNPSLEAQLIFSYLDCLGVEQTITLNPETFANFCACQNSLNFSGSGEYSFTGLTECDVCVCKTYDVVNADPDFPSLFEYTDCLGDQQIGSVPPDDFVRVCACEGSIEAGAMSVFLVGDCPLPFSADCRNYGVSYSAATMYAYTYTGCCGTEQTANIPPGVSLILKINYPAPTPPGITAVLLGSTTPPDCPPIPQPIPSFTADTGTAIVGRNLCDNTLMYFLYSGDTISSGQYFNYEYEPYQLVSLGGGGLVPLNSPYIFNTEGQVLSAFPCPDFTGNTCLDTTIISEPFFFYLDGECSPGDRLIYFMSKFGTWETYNFRAREDVGYSTNKQVIQTAPELYSEGWNTPSYNGWNSQRRVWYNKVAKSGVLYTDYMPQGEMLWLSEELFQTPSVYMVNDEGYLEPIVITNTEVVMPNYQINSNKYQISIEYKSSYDTIRQNQE